jgi:hypothetical protein
MTKECIADIVRYALCMQKKHRRKKDDSLFFIWVSNNVHSDPEVQQAIRNNVKGKITSLPDGFVNVWC